MRCIFSILIIISSTVVLAQTNTSKQGNYFAATSDEYFNRVIKPWKYQFIKSNTSPTDSTQKIGQLIFWRKEPIINKKTNEILKPQISFDVYSSANSEFLQSIAAQIKMNSSCDSINKGGDIFVIGRFTLLSSSSCVNCSSQSKVDYCRGIINKILSSVENTATDNWNDILEQFIIQQSNYISK